jgi:hypothetical protein
VETISRSLLFAMPLETMQTSVKLDLDMDAARDAVAQFARPFVALSDQISDTYSQFALHQPAGQQNLRRSVWQQHEMACWYLDKRQYAQCVIVAREAVVSAAMFFLRYSSVVGKANRTNTEKALGGLIAVNPKDDNPTIASNRAWLEQEPFYDALRHVWSDTTDLRNKMAHAGIDSDTEKATTSISKTLETAVQDLIPRLEGVIQSLAGRREL